MELRSSTTVADVRASAAFATALAYLRATDESTVQDMRAVTGIAAPTGAEAARGEWVASRMRAAGLDPDMDDVGNVIAVTPAAEPSRPAIVVAAHLDTVFDAGTDLAITTDGPRIRAPGISDNGRGLAGMLALARALSAAGWPLAVPVAFVATVGEEGRGDLRGARHYMERYRDRTAAFVALDGAGASRIIHAGVGSRRLRVVVRGPGGHSWSDFGTPNPLHAVGRAMAEFTVIPLATAPRTTLTVARAGGGTSINAIPQEAWLEVDLRSEEQEPLRELEARVLEVLRGPAVEGLVCDVTVIGDRPAGSTPATHPLVGIAGAATVAVGVTPELASSSTDANVAMAMGVPAIAIGAGGDAGAMHTTAEWYDNTGGVAGLERALLVVMATAGLAPGT